MQVLGRLNRYLFAHARELALTYLCILIVTGFNLLIPSLIKQAIDIGLIQGNGNVLLRTGALILGISIIKSIFSFGQRYGTEWLGQTAAYDLRNKMYNHLQRLPFSFHNHAQTGELMSRATSDVEAVQRWVSYGLLDSTTMVILFIGISALLFTQDWQLALVALIPIPFLLWNVTHFASTSRPMWHGVAKNFAQMSAILQESLAGAHVVRAFVRESHEKEKFHQANRKLMDQRRLTMQNWGRNFPFMLFLISLSTALIMAYGGLQVLDGKITVGTVVAFNSYVLMLAMPVARLGWIVNLASEAAASGGRIFTVLDTVPEIESPADGLELGPLQGHVRFDHVEFTYPEAVDLTDEEEQKVLDRAAAIVAKQTGKDIEEAKQHVGMKAPATQRNASRDESRQLPAVLHDVSLEALPGQVVALIGATGSGKTTLINLIPRFFDATGGAVLVDGIDVRRVKLPSLRRQIGIVLQENLLFSASVRDNIAFGRPDASMEEVIAAAKAARGHEFIMELPEQYDTLVGERGITLSGGQRQRVAIARALLLDPRILILDDSTSSVDTRTEYLIQQALNTLMQGRTSFVIAQRLSTVKNADQILVMERGRIVERGTHTELLARGGRYRTIYDLQLRDQEEVAAGSQPVVEAVR